MRVKNLAHHRPANAFSEGRWYLDTLLFQGLAGRAVNVAPRSSTGEVLWIRPPAGTRPHDRPRPQSWSALRQTLAPAVRETANLTRQHKVSPSHPPVVVLRVCMAATEVEAVSRWRALAALGEPLRS